MAQLLQRSREAEKGRATPAGASRSMAWGIGLRRVKGHHRINHRSRSSPPQACGAAKLPAMPSKYAGAHVLITGGSEGIGLALAKDFVRAGSNVTLVARTLSKLEAAKAELQKVARECRSDCKVLTLTADVSSLAEVRSWA